MRATVVRWRTRSAPGVPNIPPRGLDNTPPVPHSRVTVTTFKEWLGETLDRNDISIRELSRRLTEENGASQESNRRSVRRILQGERVPNERTRSAIQEALDDHSAPSAEEEAEIERDAMEALARDPELVHALMPAIRLLLSRGGT